MKNAFFNIVYDEELNDITYSQTTYASLYGVSSLHRVIKKFSKLAAFCSRKRHLVHFVILYIRGSSGDIP